MNLIKYLLIFMLVFSSCKTAKNTTDTAKTIDSSAMKKIIKAHTDAHFNKKTVDAKLKVAFKNAKENVDFSVRLKMIKDEVIWLKGTKLISLFKAKITPEKVSFYSPYKKNYIEGSFDTLKEILGFEVDFYQLQNLLFGEALYNLSKEKHEVSLNNEGIRLTPKKQPELFEIIYNINPKHFKLDEQSLLHKEKSQQLVITYPKYLKNQDVLFPENINIATKSKNKYSNIDILVRSVIFDEELDTSFRIPEGYKEIKL